MVVADQAGMIGLVNTQVEKQFGYRRDELVGPEGQENCPLRFCGTAIADAARSVADALAQQIGTGTELSERRKYGTEFTSRSR
jgi:PAS domain S-box-containing protein